jgi:hypothetical protein
MPTQGRDSRIQGHPEIQTTEPNKSPGCITIPAQHFRCMNVAVTTSHITWYIADGAVFSPPRGMTKSSAMFSVGAQGSVNKPDPGDSGTFQNISIVGGWPGRFTVNISEPLTGGLAGQRQGARFMFRGHVSGFTLSNLNVLLPGGLNNGIANALEFNVVSAKADERQPRSGLGLLSPTNGRIINITTHGGQWGYGLAQLQSGVSLRARRAALLVHPLALPPDNLLPSCPSHCRVHSLFALRRLHTHTPHTHTHYPPHSVTHTPPPVTGILCRELVLIGTALPFMCTSIARTLGQSSL